MSDIHTLNQWIRAGEGPQLDFKTTITSYAKIAKSMVAFANSRGGKIVVGVEDKGFFVGVDVEGEKYELEKAAKQYCTPNIDLKYDKIEYQGRYALVVNVAESREKPHYAYNKKKTAQQLYIRVWDQCIVPPIFVTKMLKEGDLDVTYRTGEYYRTQKQLVNYLRENQSISVDGFMRWQKVSARNAQRMLVDYVLEGTLRITNTQQQVFELY